MNLIDFLLLLVLFGSVYAGYRKGFITGMIELVGWLGSLVLALLLYPVTEHFVERYLTTNSLMLLGVSFLLTILVIRLLVSLVLNLVIDRVPATALHTFTDRLLGVVPGLINGLVYAALLAALFLIVPFSDGLTAKTADSRIAGKLNGLLELAETTAAPGFHEWIQRAMARTNLATGSNAFIRLNFKVATAPARPDLEQKMLGLVNKERAKAGLTPLAADTALRTVARKHAADMFARGYFSHFTPEHTSPFDRINAARIRYLAAGENLALAPDLVLAHQGLMKSPGHRANILHRAFGRVGIGILDGGVYGVMVTQNFRN